MYISREQFCTPCSASPDRTPRRSFLSTGISRTYGEWLSRVPKDLAVSFFASAFFTKCL
jgi:hypothetical protein